jgi:hypothetical protein
LCSSLDANAIDGFAGFERHQGHFSEVSIGFPFPMIRDGKRKMFKNRLRARRISRYLAKIAPDYFSKRLKNPVFIIGSGRSGTTLLVNTLALHKDIATYPGEANDLWHPQAYPWRYSKLRASLPPMWVDPEEFSRLSLQHRSVSQTEMIRSVFGGFQFLMGRKCFLNKSAMLTFMIPFIVKKFPDARFVHLIRDGRAVALSYAKKQHRKIEDNLSTYQEKGFDYPFEDVLVACAKSWKLQLEEVERQTKKLGFRERGMICEMKYEDFCRDPEDVLIQIAGFVGVDSAPFKRMPLSHIKTTNYKYRQERYKGLIQEISQLMEPALGQKGYL